MIRPWFTVQAARGPGHVIDVPRKAHLMGQLEGVRRVADRYLLTEVLGRGGMGTVWRAEDELLGRVVAVKVVAAPHDLVGSGSPGATPSRSAERARREARATARLNHPGVVTVHDVVEEDDRFHIVMELVDAPNLTQLVQAEGPLSPRRVAALGGQLLDVLELAHAAGIVHRDVKPSNVMVLAQDRIKLTDFGIAALRGDPELTASGATLGSPMFMAPEQATGTSGPAADLWSLGATMYYAVEGRVPFDRPTAMATLVAVLNQPPDPARLAGALEPALTALLVRAPEDRPDGAVLRRLLAEAMADDGSVAPPSPVIADPVGVDTVSVDTVAVDRVTVDTVRLTPPADQDLAVVPDPTADPREPGAPGPPAAIVNRPAAGRPAAGSRRRKALAGVLAAAVAVVAVVLLQDDEDPADRSGSDVTNVQQGDAAAAGNRADPTGGAVAPSAATPLAPDAPSDGLGLGSVAHSSLRVVEPTDAGPAGQTLARFFDSVANPVGGYAVGVPQAFDASTAGPVTFAEFDSNMFRAGFEVRSYQAVDPWARLVQDEAQFAREHKGDRYKRERLTRRWTYRGQDAVAWEFTWTHNGERMQAREVAFRVGPRTYTVLYRSAETWWLSGGSSAWPAGFERSFHPLP
jgi:hypothetical protein